MPTGKNLDNTFNGKRLLVVIDVCGNKKLLLISEMYCQYYNVSSYNFLPKNKARVLCIEIGRVH